MIVTVTERGQFKRCRQAWDYSSHNRQSLMPISVPRPLNLGSMIHAVHEQWINNPDTDPEQLYAGVVTEYLEALHTRYQETVGAPISDVELDYFYQDVELGLAMVRNYRDYWKTPLPKDFVIVQPEQTLVIPIPGTEHPCENYVGHIESEVCPDCNNTGLVHHYLEGTLDALAQDPHGTLWIVEHKTYGQRPQKHHLETNDQFLAYIWAVTQLNLGRVGGIFYDGMWKRAEPPRGKTKSDLFIRDYLTRSPAELQSFEIELVMEVQDMANDPGIYRNFQWQGCWDCGFQKLCLAEFRDEDSDYIRETFYTTRKNTKLWAATADPD